MAWWHSPNADIKVTMSDPRGILNALAKLSEKEQRKVANSAGRKAMAPVRLDAELNAAEFDRGWTPESVKKNIAIQRSPRQGRQQGGVVYRVGVLGGARQYSHTKENVRKGRVSSDGRQRSFYKTGGSASNPGGDTWYWRFLEFGTKHSRAQPFLQRALTKNLTRVTDIVTIEFNAGLDKLFKKQLGSGGNST